ncbi:MAG: EAL domain-containing response regulator [Cellvibrionaceae bacterium]|nr:EAL domain-containing response regulator [Cellvibrionaceae bacterium]
MPERQSIRCLLLDNNEQALNCLEQQLHAQGVFQTRLCQSPDDALQTLAAGDHFDIVFTKLHMPQFDGIEMIRHLNQQPQPSAVVLTDCRDNKLLGSVDLLAREKGMQLLGALDRRPNKQTLANMLDNYDPNYRRHCQPPRLALSPSMLRSAIFQRQIEAFFQPQICVNSGRLVGAEALAYWRHPGKGIISADHFIPLAEQCGLIPELTRLVFQFCCRQLQTWLKQGINISLSINLSPLNLDCLNLPETLCEITQRYNLKPEQIIIELTESRVLQDLPTSLDILSRLRLRGFQLSLDDYGTGHSSLEKLRQIPFTELKIDKGFIRAASRQQDSLRILESIVELSKKLELKCVAEGIETPQDWELVQGLRCDTAQGYYIAKPLSNLKFESWAKHYRRGLLSSRAKPRLQPVR